MENTNLHMTSHRRLAHPVPRDLQGNWGTAQCEEVEQLRARCGVVHVTTKGRSSEVGATKPDSVLSRPDTKSPRANESGDGGVVAHADWAEIGTTTRLTSPVSMNTSWNPFRTERQRGQCRF